MSRIIEGCKEIVSAVARMLLHNMAEIEEVEFPLLCHLIVGNYNIMWQHLILISLFTFFSYVKKIV